MTWPKRITEWQEGNTAYISVPFTWELQHAYSRSVWWRQQGYEVKAGGPAVKLMPDFLKDVADIDGDRPDALEHVNPDATFTSRGCIRRCKFCAVPIIEGDLVELQEWQPKPIVCDNNLLACSRRHFDRVIDSLKPLRHIDFNQGLDARLLKPHHADRLTELHLSMVRLAWDNVNEEDSVKNAISLLLSKGIPKRKLRCYVLLNFEDTPGDALYRLETLKGQGILPNPQRYNPLDALVRDKYLSPNWTERDVRRFVRYWSKQNWLEHIPFEDYEG